MENILFESQITYTKDYIKEYLRAWFAKSKLWIPLFLPIIMIAFGIILIVEESNNIVLSFGFIFQITFVLGTLIRYYRGSSIIYAQICEGNMGQEPIYIIQFFDDNILITNSFTGNKNNYLYSVIKGVIHSKNLIVLTTEAKQIIAVEKAKFTVGNPDDLITFIKSKIEAEKKLKEMTK